MSFDKKTLFQKELQILSRFSEGLSHPVRIRILEMLSEFDELNVEEIFRALPLHKTTISHHLAKLRSLDLIRFDERHPYIYYSISRSVLESLSVALKEKMEEILERSRYLDRLK